MADPQVEEVGRSPAPTSPSSSGRTGRASPRSSGRPRRDRADDRAAGGDDRYDRWRRRADDVDDHPGEVPRRRRRAPRAEPARPSPTIAVREGGRHRSRGPARPRPRRACTAAGDEVVALGPAGARRRRSRRGARGRARHRPRRRGPRRGVDRGRRLRVRPRPGLRGERRWALVTSPRRAPGPGSRGAHLDRLRVRRHQGARPTSSGTPPTPGRSTAAPSSAASRRCSAGRRGHRSSARRGCVGPVGGNMVKTVLGCWPTTGRELAFVDDQHGCPSFTADLGAGAAGWRGPPARARSTSPTRGRPPGSGSSRRSSARGRLRRPGAADHHADADRPVRRHARPTRSSTTWGCGSPANPRRPLVRAARRLVKELLA